MRCAICDYAEGFGSDYLNIPHSPHIRVRHVAAFGDYICTACESSIDESLAEFHLEDEEIVEMDDDEE